LTELARSVIQKVFTMESIDAGSFKYQRTPVRLVDCIREIQVVFEQRLADKNLQLEFEDGLQPETTFLADQVIFTTSVLGNLISNSIKYSLPGKKIIVKAKENATQVMIDVIDSGIGIPSESLKEILDMSQKVSRPGTLGEPGTGYGLSQAEAYLKQFGGVIHIESRAIESYPDHHGTTVHITMEKSPPVAALP